MDSLTLVEPWIQMAKSFVNRPASTVSTHAFSNADANRSKSGVSSNLARCSKPRVHAKIDAIGLVDVDFPF